MKRHLLAVVIVFAILSSLTVPHATSVQNTRMPLAFTHVMVIDTEHAQARDDQTVVVAGDRISEVGPSNRASVPDGAQVVDATGKFLIPGLWDMHVHTFSHNPRSTNTWFFPLFIANGITGVRDMWTTGDDFPQVVQFRNSLADRSFLGPRYGAVGWMVDGPEPIWPKSDVVSTAQEARDFVHKVKAAGIDFVKVYTKLRPDEYFAIADEAKRVGIPFAGHVPDAVRASAASDAAQRSMEHLRNIDLGCSIREEELIQVKTWGPQQSKEMRDTYDQEKCQQLGGRLARNQTWQVPTLVVHPASHASLSQPEIASDPRMKYVSASTATRWKVQVGARRTGSEQEQGAGPAFEHLLRITRTVIRAGAPLMAGTDVGNPFVYPGFSLHDELALFVQAGLTPGEALKTATYNPAKFLGMLDRLGTVEKGKLADLVLLDANPVEDIHNTQKIRAVLLNGRYLDRNTLDRLLADAAAMAATR